MIDQIYIEEAMLDHPAAALSCNRFPDASVTTCARYGEIFNAGRRTSACRRSIRPWCWRRSFPATCCLPRLNMPSAATELLLLAHAELRLRLPLLFLQGMYRSAHYVVFVNYEDFFPSHRRYHPGGGDASAHFFSGYDCDSLALDPVTGFVEEFLPLFREHPQALLELRTKSTQIPVAAGAGTHTNCIVAYSFTPAEIAEAIEINTPPVGKRLQALQRLQARGWRIGLRFDPLIYRTGLLNNMSVCSRKSSMPSIRRCCIRSAWGVSACPNRFTGPWRGCTRTKSCSPRRWRKPATDDHVPGGYPRGVLSFCRDAC